MGNASQISMAGGIRAIQDMEGISSVWGIPPRSSHLCFQLFSNAPRSIYHVLYGHVDRAYSTRHDTKTIQPNKVELHPSLKKKETSIIASEIQPCASNHSIAYSLAYSTYVLHRKARVEKGPSHRQTTRKTKQKHK